ncbi:unnamed protein product, partial [Adineta steineri]
GIETMLVIADDIAPFAWDEREVNNDKRMLI